MFVGLALSLGADVVSAATSSSPTKVTISQLSTASNTVNNYYKKYKKLPKAVTINKKKVNMYQYYYLLVSGTARLANGNKKTITLKINVKSPPITSDTLKKGSVKQKEYVNMAKRVKKYVDTNKGKLPNRVASSRGKIKFETAVENYNRIILFYKLKKRLPTYVTATRYSGQIYYAEGVARTPRPVYIVSDHIYNKNTDNAMIKSLITELRYYGVKGTNYGLGPNQHWNVIKDKKVPKNAVIVEFFGGACAATLQDIGSKAYKSYQEDRKVYVVFYDIAMKITGLKFLERAHDDNFSDKSFKGLATPDKYLLSKGVKFYEGYTTSKVANLALSLYKLAIS